MLRKIDQFVGISVVRLPGALRSCCSVGVPADLPEVAFLQTAGIDDTDLSSAIVQDWDRSYPNYRMTFFTGSSMFDIARRIPGVDKGMRLPVINRLEMNFFLGAS